MKRIKEEGEKALFYCFAGGQQKPRFAWSRKNGEPMSRRVTVSGKKLIIRGVKKEDEGTYVCTARNVYGSEAASGRLIVKGNVCLSLLVSCCCCCCCCCFKYVKDIGPLLWCAIFSVSKD